MVKLIHFCLFQFVTTKWSSFLKIGMNKDAVLVNDVICVWWMDITPDIPFLNIQNPFTNERISIYLDKHNCMFWNTKDYFVKQKSHMSKDMVVVASA